MRKDNISLDTIEVAVPTSKFNELIKAAATMSLSEKSLVHVTVMFQNKEFIITGSMGTGTGFGYAVLWGNRVVDYKSYKGKLEPLEKSGHLLLCDLGKRKRGYEGQIVYHGKRRLVCCEEYSFIEEKTGIQASLF